MIRAENISKIYMSGAVEIPALNGMTFRIDAGQFVVILGPSGAGKTTLLNILGGMDRLTGGQLFVAGKMSENLPRDSLRNTDGTAWDSCFSSIILCPISPRWKT